MLDSAIEYYLARLSTLDIEDVQKLITSGRDLDQEFTDDITIAYGYYEGLTPAERNSVKQKATELTLQEVLEVIGRHNETFLDHLEQLIAQGLPVIDYLDRQLARAKLLPITFDNLLIEQARIR